MSQVFTSQVHQSSHIQRDADSNQRGHQSQVPARRHPARGQLTVRGRRVVAFFALLPLMCTLALVGVHKAQAIGTAPTTHLIAVQPGDTLWDISVRIAPDQDPRKTMWDIAQLNHMSTSDLHSGQPLLVPNS